MKTALLIALVAACGPGKPSEGDDDTGADGAPPLQVPDAAPVEVCGNGWDDDGNGRADDGCTCVAEATQSCYPGDPAEAGIGLCALGSQTCAGDSEFATWGDCTGAVLPEVEACNGVDDDCNGTVDDLPTAEPCTVVEVPVNIDGDCVTAQCPAEAPYPIGCQISMAGNDSRGCVASMATAPTVYFQEGDKCGVGHVSGTLQCASIPGAGLTAATCAINKPQPFYPPQPAGCPNT